MGQYTQDKRHIKIDTPLGKDALLLQGFNGEEGVSRPFHFDLRMHSENRAIAFASIVGKMATVSMLLPDQSIRYINGVIQSFAQGGTTTINTGQNTATFATYFATLVPWLSLLRHTSDCRIFQEKSVPDIIEQIFKDAGFSDFQLKLQDSYQKREYCVQWNETDLNFVSRLMEEEGIFYFFEHTKDKHLLILADRATEFKPCPLAASASYAVRQGSANQLGRVTEWHMSQDIRPGKYEIRDYGFEKPTFQLAASVSGKDPRKYEVYYYPGEFQKANDGERLVGIRMEEEETPLSQIRGSSSCQGFIPGYRFDLKDHYRKDISDKAYTLVGVYHSSDQGTNYLATATRTEDDLDYVNHFQCIPHPTPFRPPRLTSTPLMRGTQTAIVVGPAGEEIHVDKYGRVKVQFHWDREGKYDEHSSCWVRVSQPVAGKGWGAMWIPRIGQEVIVDFLDGDPDRPIITGRVYNAESMPPYTLPDEKTKSTLKSYSSKGGGGFNEIRFEDKKGSEQFFVHAEKEMDIRVKNDRREWIGRDRHLVVKRDKKELIERDQQTIIKRDLVEEIKRDHHLKVSGKQAIEVGGSQSLKVSQNVGEKFDMNHSEEVGMNYYLKAGINAVIEAGVGLTIKAGSNFITLSPAGIMITGSPLVLINSGGAALPGTPGQLVPPTAAAEAEIADTANPGSKEPTYRNQRQAALAGLSPEAASAAQSAANAPSHDPTAEESKEKKSWIEIELVDDKGKPVPGEKYRVTLPDGTTIDEGTLDEKGFKRIDGIDPGTCKITFPNLDKDAWKPK